MMTVQVLDTDLGQTLRLSGDLDTAAAQQLDTHQEGLVASLAGDLTIDLDELAYLNSTGIRSFVRLDKLVKATGHRLRFVRVSERIHRIFRYCGLDDYFQLELS
jgi:anti-sigma B factor antagonist